MKADWLGVLAVSAGIAQAGHAATINTFDRGHYRGSGFHPDGSHAYVTGNVSGELYRGWFAFDLLQFDGQEVVGATLRTFTVVVAGGVQSVTLFDVQTAIGDLTTAHLGGAPGQAIFEDLGTGADFGSRAFTGATESNQFVEYTINAAGIAAINASLGGQFAIGARNSAEGSTNRYVYGSVGATTPTDGNVQLILDFAPAIPLPSAAGLGATGLLVVGSRRRRAAMGGVH